MPDLDFARFDALTFDCYGTLIDWEAGIAGGLQAVIGGAGIEATDDDLLERYARHEAVLEAGPYQTYRMILAEAMRRVCAEVGVEPPDEDVARFAGGVGEWPAFADSTDALRALAGRFRLGVITNCDDELFAGSQRRLGVTFDWVITAEQARNYKPSLANFELAFERIGLPRERILHVAQSLFHDHVPAKSLGLTTVWIDRRRDRPGFGATPPAEATPDLVAPDMASFAEVALAS
ncbi:MAG TPA: haloacid dehalogenase type II [Candidatus Limnocylindrales bacterium]|nr:haloacid dehalogenase type II [Candidatus Limnocylindrales bacterium]